MGGDRASTLFEVTFQMRFIGGNNSPSVFVCTSKIAIIKNFPKPKNFQIATLVGPRKTKMGIQRGTMSVASSGEGQRAAKRCTHFGVSSCCKRCSR